MTRSNFILTWSKIFLTRSYFIDERGFHGWEKKSVSSYEMNFENGFVFSVASR